MYRRVLPSAILSLLLFTTGPGAVRSGGAVPAPPHQPTGGLATRGGGPTPGEQTCIDELDTPGRSPEMITLWLRQLGQSSAGIAELIRWLEFSPDYYRASRLSIETVCVDHPAQVALMGVGPPAAPQLVDEYIYFFENTRRNAWDGRYAALSCDAENRRPYDVQNPCYRLTCIAYILSSERRMAQKAVEYTRQRMAGEPGNVRVQRACQELIDRIKVQFPERERDQLFPTTPTMQ